jgi:hypothetical protein
MIEILSGRKTGQAIVTLGVGSKYQTNWELYALPSLKLYCEKNSLGLYLQNENLDNSPLRKKIQWQKLLLPNVLKKEFNFISEFCYIDTDIIVNPNSPSIFSYNDKRLALVSQFYNLPFDLNLILRRIAFYRHNYLSKDYPLDSSLFMSIKQIFDYHDLNPQPNYACTGFIMGSVLEHGDKMWDIYHKYNANIQSLTDGGEEPIVNYEFQNQFEINWLPYKFQALWLYEMAAYYPFLYENLENTNWINKCVKA